MNKRLLAALAAAAAAALSIATSPDNAAAMSVISPSAPAVEAAGLAQKTAVFCGPLGCGPVWPGPRRWEWRLQPSGWQWGHVYRPACPIDYYYACRRGPLGYGQCACWPYRKW